MAPELALFTTALGLTPPWQVVRVNFDKEAQELHLFVDFPQGSRFSCPECEASCSVYDCDPDRLWRHLNFFEHKTFLRARLPRVACPHCGVKTVQGSWARPGSGFTLLFEAFVLTLCQQMPVRAVARLVGEHDTRLWTLVGHYVEQAQAAQDMSQVRSVGVDETASRPGQQYVTLFADHDQARVVFVASGKGAATVEAFAQEVAEHEGHPQQIQEVSLDMSPAFESGVSAAFPEAVQVVDRFHVMQMVNDALDNVRRAEAKSSPQLRQTLKNTRYLWLKNPSELTKRQAERIQFLCSQQLQTVRAYQCKLSLQTLWDLPNRRSAQAHLTRWCQQCRSIPQLAAVAATLTAQADRILNYFMTGGQTNALMEGLNSLVQATKARARGFRNDRYLGWMIYLIAGKFHYPLPTLNGG